MFGNRRHFRELLTRSEERIASNIPRQGPIECTELHPVGETRQFL
jgi:hypothetical protein